MSLYYSALQLAVTMLPTLLLIAISATQTIAQLDQSCGFKTAPCPSDMICENINPACSRGEDCAGTCQPGPYYNDFLSPTPKVDHLPLQTSDPAIIIISPTTQRRGCGVRMIGGVYNCEADEQCVDDPSRLAGSCGMACDRPGICVKKVSDLTPCSGSGRLREALRAPNEPRTYLRHPE